MKYGVSRNILLKSAGLIWLIAGLNILRIGSVYWINDPQHLVFKIGETGLIFLFFAGFIFQKVYLKNTRRISHKKDRNCPFSFFDFKGWGTMAAMITLGVLVRSYQLLPEWTIGIFYTGLSLALIVTGIRFLIFRKAQPAHGSFI